MTETQSKEDELLLSEENMKVVYELADALEAGDLDRIYELQTKMILPLKTLKYYGSEYVIRNGLPTITAEIANDTDWLK
jgi:hypothetical protein